MNIKPDMLIMTVDGPFYAPNHRRTVRVINRSDVPGAWNCKDFTTGEMLTMQESKLLESLRQSLAATATNNPPQPEEQS